MNKKNLILLLKNKLLSDKTDHWVKIKSLKSINEAFAYSKVNLTGPQYGPLLEKYLINRYKWKQIQAKKMCGDIKTNRHVFELKVSLSGSEKKPFNFNGIRNQPIDFYILIAYYVDLKNSHDLGELFIFKLNKDELYALLGKHFSHGCKSLWEKVDEKIKKLGVVYKSAKWSKLLKYRISEQELKSL